MVNGIKTRAEVEAQLEVFLAKLSDYANKKNICAHIYAYVFTVERGAKNVRIVRAEKWGDNEPSHRSVHCFVRMEDGAILKAGGWKAPAKNPVRGSIFAADCDIGEGRAVGEHGCAYLR